MTLEDRLQRAKAAIAYREAHWNLTAPRMQRELAAAVHRAERRILTALNEGMSRMGVIRPEDVFNGSKGQRAMVRAVAQSVEDMGYGPLGESFKDWTKSNLPMAYKEGARDGEVFVQAMSGVKADPRGVGHEFLHWRWEVQDKEALRGSLTQAYRFANEISAQGREYFRATFTRAVAERWTRKQLMDELVSGGELTGLVDKAGRYIPVQRRAQMFADWHLNDTWNTAQRTHDEKTFGKDRYEIWDGVIDSHTSDITLQRVGKIAKHSEWQAAGENVFDGSGIPPLWPGCRCKLRAVDPAWFEDADWSRAMEGEPLLTGRDAELHARRTAELAAQAA